MLCITVFSYIFFIYENICFYLGHYDLFHGRMVTLFSHQQFKSKMNHIIMQFSSQRVTSRSKLLTQKEYRTMLLSYLNIRVLEVWRNRSNNAHFQKNLKIQKRWLHVSVSMHQGSSTVTQNEYVQKLKFSTHTETFISRWLFLIQSTLNTYNDLNCF